MNTKVELKNRIINELEYQLITLDRQYTNSCIILQLAMTQGISDHLTHLRNSLNESSTISGII